MNIISEYGLYVWNYIIEFLFWVWIEKGSGNIILMLDNKGLEGVCMLKNIGESE